MDDPYKTLGISRDASEDEVKKAYKKLCLQYHPDKTNGDKEKEVIFKKINGAYEAITNPQLQQQQQQQQHGFPPGFPGGFSFGGQGGGMPDIFSEMFNGFNQQQRKAQIDIIEIPVTINDLYHGTTKKIEFELLDICEKCKGSGGADSSSVFKCHICKGVGMMNQQMGPFIIQGGICPACHGAGSIIKKPCLSCNGEKHVFKKKLFDLKLPKNIPNTYEIKLDKVGAYDPNTKHKKDMIFKFNHDIKDPYSIVDNSVMYTMEITIDELLGGFTRDIVLFDEDLQVSSDGYFNPSRPIVFKEKGLQVYKNTTNGDLLIKFNILYNDSVNIKKSKEVFTKIFKHTIPVRSFGLYKVDGSIY